MSRAPWSASWSPRGERVVRVPPKLMGESRRGERGRGKSDPIDALAIARAALREGPETLPAAYLDEDAMQVKLLLDHREDLVKARSEEQCRLRWHLHDLWPELEIPAGALDRMVWLERVARKLSRAEQGARVAIARELVQRDPSTHPPDRRARTRDRGPGQGPGPRAARAGGLRRPDRGQADRRDGRRRAPCLRRQVRPPRRRRPDPRLLGQPRPPPPRPRRQPPAQLRPAPHRRHPGPHPPAGAGVPRPKAGRRQVQNGGAALPQASPGAPGLEAFGRF